MVKKLYKTVDLLITVHFEKSRKILPLRNVFFKKHNEQKTQNFCEIKPPLNVEITLNINCYCRQNQENSPTQ